MYYRIVYASKISLTSPDPSQGSQTPTLHSTASSETDTVTYIPQHKATKPKNTKYKTHNLLQTKDQHYAHKSNGDDLDSTDGKDVHLGTVEDVTHLYTKKEEL